MEYTSKAEPPGKPQMRVTGRIHLPLAQMSLILAVAVEGVPEAQGTAWPIYLRLETPCTGTF